MCVCLCCSFYCTFLSYFITLGTALILGEMPLDKITDGLMELIKTQMVPLSLVSINVYVSSTYLFDLFSANSNKNHISVRIFP